MFISDNTVHKKKKKKKNIQEKKQEQVLRREVYSCKDTITLTWAIMKYDDPHSVISSDWNMCMRERASVFAFVCVRVCVRVRVRVCIAYARMGACVKVCVCVYVCNL